MLIDTRVRLGEELSMASDDDREQFDNLTNFQRLAQSITVHTHLARPGDRHIAIERDREHETRGEHRAQRLYVAHCFAEQIAAELARVAVSRNGARFTLSAQLFCPHFRSVLEEHKRNRQSHAAN